MRQLSDGRCLRTVGNSEPDADWKLRHTTKPLHGGREVSGDRIAHTGYAKTTDEVHESASIGRDLAHPFNRSRRRHETDERQAALPEPTFALGVRSDRKVGDQHSVDSGVSRALEAPLACCDEWIQIGEEHHRNVEGRRRYQIEGAIERHSFAERMLRAYLYHWSVGNRVGEWNTNFNYVGSFFLEASHEGD